MKDVSRRYQIPHSIQPNENARPFRFRASLSIPVFKNNRPKAKSDFRLEVCDLFLAVLP